MFSSSVLPGKPMPIGAVIALIMSSGNQVIGHVPIFVEQYAVGR